MKPSLGIALTLSLCFSASSAADAFSDKLKGLTKKSGFFNLYGSEKQSSLLLEVDKLEQPFIYVTSLMQGIGSNDLGLDRGQLGDSRLVQFERIGNKVILRQLNPYYRAVSDNPSERKALTQAFAQSVLFSFTIVAEREGKLLIDVEDFVEQDVHGVAKRLKQRGEGSYRVNTSTSMPQWAESKSFAQNTELTALVSFTGEPKGRHLSTVTPDARYVSIHFRHSLVQLPEAGYEMREFHPYSGYFPFEFQDYSQPIDKPMTQRYIYRHRLTTDAMGKVVEPIVYYLDPGVPEPVRGALLDGARWWSDAFDKAGFKGGFRVEMLPSDADPLDARYNVIQWVHRSTRGWSYGGSVSDPRTGEIIKGHVSLGSLRVRQDYLIASGLLADQDKAKASEAAQAMALARIRQLSAHEIGHTLGIAHNFAASANNRASVMDYPHPLIELQDKHINLDNAYAVGMGAWDDYTVAYGYGELTNDQLAELIKKTKRQGLGFISDSDARAAGGSHPWAHLWDNGKKADQELQRLILVRELALKRINESMLDPSQAHSEMREAIVPIYLLHRYQVEAASKIIGGIDYNYALSGEKLLNQVVDADWQRQALVSVLNTLSAKYLSLPSELIAKLPPKAYGFYNSRESFSSSNGLNIDPVAMSEASARHSLKYLLHSARLNRVLQQGVIDRDQLSLQELLQRLIARVIKESSERDYSGLTELVAKRVNVVVVEQLLAAYHHKQTSPETKAVLHKSLTELQKWFKKQAKRGEDDFKSHFKLLEQGLDEGLEDASLKLIAKPTKLPPGSPI
ncbi:zinc-dependent metalloprotease [Psychrobium sp. 1_MG-2023]|uniref:zinc-dependent metalloprotease n=1 Tax=Psychrobium sp. 1_MG-2023 TaxID=3062624 RepID=UPI00273722E8|nr:zinc-dependent metalloprotease [Psychrobium sp. 1_MG-2023]MDP2559612.1 zinc-dependent metalloprotease [Psychrobium sp. 1_MG-2023]